MRKVFLDKLLRPLFLIFGAWLILSIGSEYAQGKEIKKGLFLGAGLGYGKVKKGSWGDESGFNALGRFGFGLNEYLLLELEFDSHCLNEGAEDIWPLIPPGLAGGSLAYYCLYKTSYILASLQYCEYKGFYLRAGVGVVINRFADTQWEGEGLDARYIGSNIIKEKAFAFGFSLGYEFRVIRHLALSLEGLFRTSGGTDHRTVLGIEVVGIWYFKYP
jgi:opacity protein-like surface antigen